MLSGLFDRYPEIEVILGHLGEGLPFTLPRLEHRLHMQRKGAGLGAAKQPVSHYFNQNFLITTSGHFHTRTLECAIGEIGSDRVMFSVDYPYETMQEAADWFDASLLCHNDRLKVGRDNAARLFRIARSDFTRRGAPTDACPTEGLQMTTGDAGARTRARPAAEPPDRPTGPRTRRRGARGLAATSAPLISITRRTS
jgi:hypothetical protein